MATPAALPWTPPRHLPGLALLASRRALQRAASLDGLAMAVLAGSALVLALTHPWSHAYIGNAQYGDAAYWDFAGESWARGYVATKAPDIRPGYSVFLGIVYSLFGPSFGAAFAAQALLYALGVAMLYVLGKAVAGRFTGWLAAALFILDPYVWEWTATSTTELLGSIANLLALLCLALALRSPRSGRWMIGFGFGLAVANVVRPVTLPFLAPALLVLLLARQSWQRRLRLVAVAVGATVISLLPSVVYQYASTGDAGLSSNGPANLFAASSPAYGSWSPAIYADVSAQLTARGIPATPENVNAEFMRLTVQNYLQYPGFQLQRISDELRNFAAFEGETERPERYVFYRPLVLIGAAVASCALALLVRPRLLIWVVPAAGASVLLLHWSPLATLGAAQLLGLLLGLRGLVGRRPRQLVLLAVALYWLTTGLAAIVTAGVTGFFLNRLYTQVEPTRALLLATATAAVLVPTWGRALAPARMLSLQPLVRRTPRLPASSLGLVRAVALSGALIMLFGALRLVAANVAPAGSAAPLAPPEQSQLAALARQLGLPSSVPTYVSSDTFMATRAGLVAGTLPGTLTSYAVPGEFTRFLWHLPDQDRTLFWYVFSDHTRPTALDRNLLTVEVPGELSIDAYRDRTGLLILVPTSAYFDATGDVAQQNVLAARAFVPFDQHSQHFEWSAAVEFPLVTHLYDHVRFQAAHTSGSVKEAGPIRVRTDDLQLRALDITPQGPSVGPLREAAITYPGVAVPAGSHVRVWVALTPRLFNHQDVPPVRVELRRGGSQGDLLGWLELDAQQADQQRYLPLEVDLGQAGAAATDLTLRVTQPASGEAGELFVGEPELVTP